MKPKILIAIKNRIAGDALQLTLTEQGYKVNIINRNILTLDQQLKATETDIVIIGEVVVDSYYQKLNQTLKSLNPMPQIAFILGNRTAGFVIKGLQKGVEGFIHKESGLIELKKCLEAFKKGYTYISPSLSGKIKVKEFLSDEKNSNELTCREKEIILLVKENRTSREIGEILNLSTKTIQNHRQNMCNKLGLKGRNKLYEYALENY